MRAVDVAFAGVSAQAELVRRGKVTARELTQLSLARIARHDPVLNAFRVVLAESALAAADAVDAGPKDGLLCGVPIAVKDDMDLAGEVTAKGSIAHGGPAARDCELVAWLREQGAILIGKTNVPELMTMAFTETLWYGATRNPWDPDRTPGGSSGGSAAAVAAGLVAAATASDGAGSIRIPAACTGLVGLKPGPGVVPTPENWNGLATFGFLTRTVADAELLYRRTPLALPPGLRVAWSVARPLGALGRPDRAVLGAIDAMSTTLRGLGHEVFERDPDLGLVGPKLLARLVRGIHDDARGMAHPERLDRRTRGLARLGGAIPPPALAALRRGAAADRARIEGLFAEADVLLLPVVNTLPPRVGAYEGKGAVRSLHTAAAFTPLPSVFNHTGLPAISVPAARTPDGFPLGVQLVGPSGAEDLLLALAAQLEVELGWVDRRPPGFE